MDAKLKVPVSRAQELIRSIRILAVSGRAAFKKYLHDPLYFAGWHLERGTMNSRKLIDRLKVESEDPSFLGAIAPRCKRLISYAVDEGFSVTGDSAIFFLEKMQMHLRISSSPESIEFASIVGVPLDEFRKLCDAKSESLFKQSISKAADNEIINAFEPVKLHDEQEKQEKVRIDGEIRKLYDNILVASKYHNIPKCMKLLSNYIIKYGDDESYSKADVDKLVTALDKREVGFENEMRSTIAIELYYRITRAVLGGDIAAAVQGIRKYGYIFEGNAETKHFYDIDRLERALYQIIGEKGIWKELKKGSGGA